MEEEKEMKNSSPQKENMAARNGHFVISSSTPSQLHPSINGHINITTTTTTSSLVEEKRASKKVVKYKECMKNHAAAIGGNATDGCGEFMPTGEEGTIEALKCSACGCHRNFHRKEINGGDEGLYEHHHHHNPPFLSNNGVILGHAYPINSLVSSRPPQPQPHQMILSYKSGSVPSESDEKDDEHGMRIRHVDHHQKLKKRFRTKFTEEQKEKMLIFAEKAGWKMQKLEESMVQRFCQELGIKRKVLKVWMHNNKHNFAKKNSSTNV